jgi:hypothetical protein
MYYQRKSSFEMMFDICDPVNLDSWQITALLELESMLCHRKYHDAQVECCVDEDEVSIRLSSGVCAWYKRETDIYQIFDPGIWFDIIMQFPEEPEIYPVYENGVIPDVVQQSWPWNDPEEDDFFLKF